MEESPTLLGDGLSRHDAPQRDTSRHTMTIKQAAELFVSFGVARSPRSVQRFCELGTVDAIRVKGDKTEQYFIDPLSVERYAEELRQLKSISQIGVDVSRHDAPQRDTSRHDATEPLASTPPASTPEPSRETVELSERVVTLERENMQLKIDLGGRTFFINQMVDERRNFIEQLTSQSREIGRLESRVELLETPKEDLSRHDATDAAEAVAGEGRGAVHVEPALPAPIETPRPGFFRRVFGK